MSGLKEGERLNYENYSLNIIHFSGDDTRSYSSTVEYLRQEKVIHHGPELAEVCLNSQQILLSFKHNF